MKIRIDDTIYEGTGAEILEQLRLAAFDPTEFPDTESYDTLYSSRIKARSSFGKEFYQWRKNDVITKAAF